MVDPVDFEIAALLLHPVTATEYLSAIIEDGDQGELSKAMGDLTDAYKAALAEYERFFDNEPAAGSLEA